MKKPKFFYEVYAGGHAFGCGPIICSTHVGRIFALTIRGAYRKAHILVHQVEERTGHEFAGLSIR